MSKLNTVKDHSETPKKGLAKATKAVVVATAISALAACGNNDETERLRAENEQLKAQVNSPSFVIKQECRDAGYNDENTCLAYLAGKDNALGQMARDYTTQRSSGTVAHGSSFWDFAETAILVGGGLYAGKMILDSFSPKYRTQYESNRVYVERKIPTQELQKMRSGVNTSNFRMDTKTTQTHMNNFSNYSPYKAPSVTVNGKKVESNTKIPSTQSTPGAVKPNTSGSYEHQSAKSDYAKTQTPVKTTTYTYKAPSVTPSRSSSVSSSRSSGRR